MTMLTWKMRILRFCRRILDLFTNLLFWIIYQNKSEALPPVTDLILLESALSLAVKIRTRKLTSTQLVEAFISRIKEVQPIINGIVDERFSNALEDAKNIDEFVKSGQYTEKEMEEKMPFLGIPFTIKDCIGVKGVLSPHILHLSEVIQMYKTTSVKIEIFCINNSITGLSTLSKWNLAVSVEAGMSQTAGLVSKKGTKAEEDADVIVLLREAGAIPLAITNVSELCMWWETSNNLYGQSNNPYNNTRIVGGSSGGEGCLLASAGSVIGIGSDISGCIRIPSFMNGIFGHKGSTGIVSNQGEYPSAEKELDSFLSTGPMCRYASDLLPMFKVLAGKNASKLKLDTMVNIRYLKIYYMEDDGGNPYVTQVCTEMKMAMQKVITHLKNMYGIKSQKIYLSKMKHSFNIWAHKMASVGAPSFSSEILERKGELNGFLELLKWMCMFSNHTLPAIGVTIFEKLYSAGSSEERSQFVNMCTDLQHEFQELLGDEGIFLYPTHPEPASFHHQSIFKPYSIGYTAIFNVLGLPVTQCPLGLSKNGLPLGVQVVAGKNSDHLTLALAVVLEKIFGGWVCPSPTL